MNKADNDEPGRDRDLKRIITDLNRLDQQQVGKRGEPQLLYPSDRKRYDLSRGTVGSAALITGLACWFLPLIILTPGMAELAFFNGILAIILGAIGFKIPGNRGMSIAGFVLGCIYMFFFLLGIRWAFILTEAFRSG